MFQGFPEETIKFFLDVRFHNDMAFVHAHEKEYKEYVKQPFYSFIEALGDTMLSIADDMEIRPVKCLARLRRDTRFTKDKSPYRDHLWLCFRRAGASKEGSVNYWFELTPETVDWGLGFWFENRSAMNTLRKRMVEKPDEVLEALRKSRLPGKDLLVDGRRYQRMKPPEGMALPLALLYPMKEMFIQRVNVPFGKIYTPEILDMVRKDFLRLKPMYKLLCSVADEANATLDP